MIDTHCHIDMYDDPAQVAEESESKGIITIAVTNLPSHFEIGFPFTRKYKKVRLALGLHPLFAEFHKDEMPLFLEMLNHTSYIGEVGLDFSKAGIASKEIQIDSFKTILRTIKNKPKVLTIHSRGAELETILLLEEFETQNAIFHWYTGNVNLIERIVKMGYYFSINPKMIDSLSGKQVIKHIPSSHILTESDGPYAQKNNEPFQPKDVEKVINYLASSWAISFSETEAIIDQNFKNLVSTIVVQ